jgi:hypothetical protein
MNNAVAVSTIGLAVVAGLAFAINVLASDGEQKAVIAAAQATEATTRQVGRD